MSGLLIIGVVFGIAFTVVAAYVALEIYTRSALRRTEHWVPAVEQTRPIPRIPAGWALDTDSTDGHDRESVRPGIKRRGW